MTRHTQAIALVVAMTMPAADASFPGRNGRLVFVSDRAASPGQTDRDGDLYTIGADGRGLKTLTVNRSYEYSPKWSPRGKRLVFSRYRAAPNVYALHVVRADGSGLKKITSPRGRNDISPSWSPSGRRIAFVRAPANSRGGYCARVHVVNADGTGLTRITPECNQYGELAWSPDGRHFAFTRWASELYVMDADGSDTRRLLASTPLVSGFAWSPDARRIAFTRGDLPGIWVVNVDDTGEAVLVPDVQAANLSWSPDGREIAFTTVDPRIAVATIGTGSVRVLGAGGIARADFQPDWQPLP
jgi:TolB protein